MSHKLHVVTCISNPVQYERRYQLFREFVTRMEAMEHIELYCVEMAFGERDFVVTDATNPRHIQVRGHTELWHKENLLNIGFKRLPFDWKYACWMDSDIIPLRVDWAKAVIDQLQHYRVVQGFSHIYDMTYETGMSGGVTQSYIANWIQRDRKHYNHAERSYTKVGAPGYVWAFRREAFETVEGLFDLGILGSGDYYMADAMTGNTIVELEQYADLHPNYVKAAYDWRERALKLNQDIGCTTGSIAHYWHGPRVNRGYGWRNNILVKHQYDPTTDVRYNSQGLLVLNDNKPGLRDDIRDYFRFRDEDARK